MSLDKKLSAWQRAGLIDSSTAGRIAAYEGEHSRPILLHALGGLGALAIGIGVISIVASNWDAISKTVKLTVDLVVLVMLAAGILHATRAERRLASEVLVIVYYASTLASIALIGQVYQLSTPLWQGLAIWSAVTPPLVLLGRGALLGVMWFGGLAASYGAGLDALFEWVRDQGGRHLAHNVTACTLFVAPLLFTSLPAVPWLRARRETLARAFATCSWIGFGVAGALAPFLFYDDVGPAGRLDWALLVTAVLAALWVRLFGSLLPELSAHVRFGVMAMLGFSWVCLALGTSFSRDEWQAVGAISQVAFLGIAAWTVAQLGHVRLFHVVTALIGLRILVMYFEVFGSLLGTGLGMITGGLLTLLLAWAWKRKSPSLAAQLTPKRDEHDAP